MNEKLPFCKFQFLYCEKTILSIIIIVKISFSTVKKLLPEKLTILLPFIRKNEVVPVSGVKFLFSFVKTLFKEPLSAPTLINESLSISSAYAAVSSTTYSASALLNEFSIIIEPANPVKVNTCNPAFS